MRRDFVSRAWALRHRALSPSQVLVFGFGLIIGVGAALLSLPAASNGKRLSPVDALFTATSAVCVTGLTVVDTGTFFSPLGQGVILALVQVGGVGFITMAVAISALIGRRVGLRGWLLMQEAMGHPWVQGMACLALRVLGAAMAFEGIGAVLLFLRWLPKLGVGRAAWFAVFHSVTAFANASFDLFGQLGGSGLSAHRADPWVNAVVGGLMVLGGLGITVLNELWRWPPSRRFSLHTRLVLVVSGALLLGGTLALFAAESEAGTPMGKLPPGERLMAAAFHSASARTCGFTTLPLAELSGAGKLALLVLMFIGASSASMGGGVKTNTIGAILAALWSMAKGRDEAEAFGRTIPKETVYKALAVISGAAVWIGAASFVLAISESQELTALVFETVSAFSTVGYSLGATPRLTPLGRLVIAATMFVGRLGPLTVVAALARRWRPMPTRYPEEKILIG